MGRRDRDGKERGTKGEKRTTVRIEKRTTVRMKAEPMVCSHSVGTTMMGSCSLGWTSDPQG